MKKHTSSNNVEIYIGGCTGSTVVSAERIFHLEARGITDAATVISLPVSRATFGTQTTSIAILMGSTGVLIDNGTGVQQASEWLKAKGAMQVFILQSHYHLDHISGLPFNGFLMNKNTPVKAIYGPTLPGGFDFDYVMKYFFIAPFWPVWPKKFGIELPIHAFVPGETIPVMGGIKTMLLNHDGGSVAYRIPTPAGDIVIATDNELSNSEIRERCASFFSGAALAYIDLQYRNDEYDNKATIGPGETTMSRKGWGHSTPSIDRK